MNYCEQSSRTLLKQVADVSVIPVLVLDEPAVAGELAKVLVDAGLPVLEVTLRTEQALAVIEAMAQVDGAIVGAGTVLNESQVKAVNEAGAQFMVSPGATPALIDSAMQYPAPLLPGAATASDVQRLLEYGFQFMKFFPAEANGGVKALKALSGPFPHVSFCPTGGVSPDTVADYLSVSTVVCAGGSWLVTADDLRTRDWSAVERRVKALSDITP